MSSQKPSNTLNNIRDSTIQAIIDDINHTLSETRGDQCLIELRKHIYTLLRNIVKLKILDASTLSAAKMTMDTHQEWNLRQTQLDNMRVVADAMFYLNEDIKNWHVPEFEIMTALSCLVKGRMNYFPTAVDALVNPKPLCTEISSNLLSFVSAQILTFVEKVDLKNDVQFVGVSNGIATFCSPKQFRIRVTLSQSATPQKEADAEKPVITTIAEESMEEKTTPIFALHVADLDFNENSEVERHWWWTLTELTFFLKNEDGAPFFEDFQVEFMRRELDLRMSNYAQMIMNKRTLAERTNAGTGPSPSPQTVAISSTTCASGLDHDELKADSLDDGDIAPLNLLFDFCRETSNRAVMTAIRATMKKMISEDSRFMYSCRMVISKVLKFGYRLYYWHGVPVISSASDKNQKVKAQWPMFQPWLEVGIDACGQLRMEQFMDMDTSAEEQRSLLSCIDVRQLVLHNASILSRTILQKLSEILTFQKTSTAVLDVTYELLCQPISSETRQDLNQCDESVSVQAPSLTCTWNGRVCLQVLIELTDGRLRLIANDVKDLPVDVIQLWEDKVNHVWKKSARDTTNREIHPHIASLGFVAKELCILLNALIKQSAKQANPESILHCVKHGVTIPSISSLKPIPAAAKNVSEGQIDARMGQIIPIKRLALSPFRRAKDSTTFKTDEFQLVLSSPVENESGGECMTLFLLSLDDRGSLSEIATAIPVPSRLLQKRASSRKRKHADQDDEHTRKREKLKDTSDKDSLSLSKELVAWCCRKGQMEVLKLQLAALEIVSEEQFIRDYSDSRLRIISGSGTRDTSQETIRELVLEAEYFTSHKEGFTISSDSDILRIIDRSLPPPCSVDSRRTNTIQQNKPTIIDSGIKFRYTDAQYIEHMLRDVHLASAYQILFDSLQEIAMQQLVGANGGGTNKGLRLLSVGMAGVVIELCGGNANGDLNNGSEVSRWTIRFHIRLSTHISTAKSQGNKAKAGSSGSPQNAFFVRQLFGPMIKCGVHCSIRSDMRLPSVLLKRWERSVELGDIRHFVYAITTTAGVLIQMQSLQESSTNWTLYTLPQSTAMKWYLLCRRESVERSLIMHFNEGGFLFVKVEGGSNTVTECHDVGSSTENFAMLIQSLLDNSV